VALGEATVIEVLELIAARTPAPGGGAAAALPGATAAALTEMAAAFAAEREHAARESNAGHIRDRASVLRARLLKLADEDAAAFGPVLDALRRTDSGRAAALTTALSAAAEPPIQIVRAATEIAELAAGAAAEPGNDQLLGDATAAAALAEAAARAAARLVQLNLARAPEDLRLSEADELIQRAAQAREETLKLRA
jgi:formiminotetrahydrofolate cyclodeaminase